ncbi:hypothetical protein CLOBY_18140 [Clostridium saccharobutylicum]|uniref:phage tail terminator family protein n=1 Tax=Clostridium saccharobutylicum TaxID=169679 RepID=UPI000983F8E6|nr:hypothetical protein [Clostridium saccharobutylicum]AQS09683.1 hypothetical protein CLOBY_18140 [Clostridium saccharobutylicum]MBC2436922.1 hypothetical protein [Clostridium saccharobutylicum]NSB89273.1 hypothetical protein [Clostridium saccharobutylicum]NYC27927.1 hypothetical protein [Clostridium saccharobutylicum]OOM17122.1 hypothetical protein CLSAB_20700 [Clostridium saccharobutylicum]
MIALSTILTAINNNILNALANTHYKDVEIVSKDFTDGIIRPAIRVLYSTSAGKFNAALKERVLNIKILFYAKDKNAYKLDNINMQDILENAFLEDLEVQEGFFMSYCNANGDIEPMTSDIVDTVLQCSFNLYSRENIYDDSSLEDMEDLEINLTDNN